MSLASYQTALPHAKDKTWKLIDMGWFQWMLWCYESAFSWYFFVFFLFNHSKSWMGFQWILCYGSCGFLFWGLCFLPTQNHDMGLHFLDFIFFFFCLFFITTQRMCKWGVYLCCIIGLHFLTCFYVSVKVLGIVCELFWLCLLFGVSSI